MIVMALIIVPSLSSANIISIFPARASYTLNDNGEFWTINHTISIVNNNSFDQDVSFEVINIGNSTYKNKVNIYNGTIYSMHESYDESYMRLFADIPNTSWVKVPSVVTVPHKNDTKATIINVPVQIIIPKDEEFDNNFYQCYVEIKPIANNSIQTSLSSKLLLQTPALSMDDGSEIDIFSLIIPLIALVSFIGGTVLYYMFKKGDNGV